MENVEKKIWGTELSEMARNLIEQWSELSEMVRTFIEKFDFFVVGGSTFVGGGGDLGDTGSEDPHWRAPIFFYINML